MPAPATRSIQAFTASEARMRYYQQVLRDTETLAFFCRLHWIVFARPALLLLAALVFWVGGSVVTVAHLPSDLAGYAALLLFAFAIFGCIGALIRWYTTEIAVTDRRVIYKRGLISRRTVEMNVSKIETVDVEQGPIARLLGYGDVIIRGTGGTFEPLKSVTTPIELRNAILVG